VKYAFSTNAFTRSNLIDAIEQVHAAGYSGVEILADRPHAFPYDLSCSDIVGISRVLEKTGLRVSNVNANTALGFYPPEYLTGEVLFEPSLCSSSEDSRNMRINFTKECIDLAAAWGAHCISITSGRSLPGNPPQQAYRNFINSLEQILNHAVQKGILVGIEYEPGLLIENAEEVERVLTDVNSSYLGVNLDIGHSVVAGEEAENVICRFQNKIWNVHLEDICARKHYHLIPGDGDIPFQQIFAAFDSIGYDRFITMELYTYVDAPEEAAKRAISYLEKFKKGEEM
jgi:fructoselysine 3-epimerase